MDKTKELVISTSNTPYAGLNPTSIHGKTVGAGWQLHLGLIIENWVLVNTSLPAINDPSKDSLLPSVVALQKNNLTHPAVLFPLFLHHVNHLQQKQTYQHHTCCLQNHLPSSPNLLDMNHRAITCLALTIAYDTDHPLNQHFTLLPSGWRYRTLQWRRAHFRGSFVPSALTHACILAKGQTATIYTDSRYAFGVTHDFTAMQLICQSNSALETETDSISKSNALADNAIQ